MSVLNHPPQPFRSPRGHRWGLLAAGILSAVLAGPLPAEPHKDAAGAIERYLGRLAGFGYSGAILVAVDGRIIVRAGYGYADRARRIANRPGTVFDIGSLSKNFTAAAILRLEADGKLQVDDSLGAFLPYVPADKRAITLHQLLTHTSGVTAHAPAYEDIGKRAAIDRILSTPLQCPPGSKWEYSNAGYVLLAAVIERASGEPFQDYLTRHLFRPAGMTSTGFWGSRLPRHTPGSVAKGYDESGAVADLEKLSGQTWVDIGSGQIVSTVDDLYRWQQALELNVVLPADEVRRMLTPVMTEGPSASYYTSSYGCGIWAQTLPDGTRRYQHGGDFLGFGSQLTWLPDRKTVIVSLCNVRHDLFPVHRRADRAIPDLLARAPVTEPPAFVSLPPRVRQRFVGTYVLATGSRLTVVRSATGLAIGAKGQDATMHLDGHRDDQAQLAAQAERARHLVTSLMAGDDSGLAEVGLGDADARRGIHAELDSLSKGLGAFKAARTVGTYWGGLSGKFLESLVELRFASGHATYRLQWDGDQVVGTDLRCPPLAAMTSIQPTSAHDLVGWNIVTLMKFSLRFDHNFASLTIVSGADTVRAERVRGPMAEQPD